MSIYQDLLNAGLQIDHHCSDLYTPHTSQAIEILQKHGKTIDGHNVSQFTSNIDGKPWLNIPFQYDPYWENKIK